MPVISDTAMANTSTGRSILAAATLGKLVQSRQQQQVLDQDSHSGGLGLDPAHRALERRRIVGGSETEQLGIASNRRQRRAQLVRRVGEEVAQAFLALAAVPKCPLDLSEHLVQR